MSTPRIFALAGSLRAASFNRALVRAFAALAPTESVDVYDDLGALPLLNEDIEAAAFAAGPVHDLRARVAQADALFIATPEYNHAPPGVLKNALDWLSRPLAGDVLAGKRVALAGATSGRWGTRLAQAGLRQVVFALDANVLPGPALYLANAAAAFDGEGRLVDADVRASLLAIAKPLS
jgi:chromate reductase